MDETCIVCLGDLNHGLARQPSPAALAAAAVPEHHDDTAIVKEEPEVDNKPEIPDEELVAHLLPCGHYLHDSCLKPWVERANSCPICRTSFNLVELSATVGGPVLSTYAVDEKQQVADVDPSLVVDDDFFDEDIGDPCMVCEEVADDHEVLTCECCDEPCHVFCAGFDEAPDGPWICHRCRDQQGTRRRPRRRAAAAGRSHRARPGASLAWERVWRSIFNRLDFDLDFPFDEDDPARVDDGGAAHAIPGWQRRLQIAASQGAGSRFRETAAALVSPKPEPESQDEIRAWNAFEKARQLDERPGTSVSSARRKRKSVTMSPAEPTVEPERKLKRPRTRRPVVASETAGEDVASSSRQDAAPKPSKAQPAPPPPAPLAHRGSIVDKADGPSFLQSLLQEVEAPPAPLTTTTTVHDPTSPSAPLPIDHASPQRMSSPDTSPAPSNHASPRSMTPPPYSPRPMSPPPLTSTVSPTFPLNPEFSPFSPASSPRDRSPDGGRARPRLRRVPAPHASPHHSRSPPPPGDVDGSPTRATHVHPTNGSPHHANGNGNGHPAGMSYSAKAEIQRMVGAVLKPHYLQRAVSKEEYTAINREVSRRLYERVGDATGLQERGAREMWQRVAREEVERAVGGLKREGG